MTEQLQGWLRALAEIGASVNSGVSLPSLLNRISRTACELMSYDLCAITIPDALSEVLTIEGFHGFPAESIHEINSTHPIRLRGVHQPTPSSQAFALGIPIQASDISSTLPLAEWRAAAADAGLTSMISVPLNSADKILGTLNCYTRLSHHFTQEEESLLRMLADQAAVAITTSRLRSEQGSRIADLNVLNQSLEEQYELQRQSVAIHERLTTVALDSGGVIAIGEALAELLGRPVAICESNGSVLYNTERADVSLPGEALLAAATLPSVISTGDAGLLADVRLPDSAGGQDLVRAPVMIKDKIVAWIWTTGQVSNLRLLDRQTLERAATPLALELLRTRTTAEAEWRDAGQILSSLLMGTDHGSPALMAQAAILGHDLSFPHALIALRANPVKAEPFPHWLAAAFAGIDDSVTPKPLIGSCDGYIVALWPLAPQAQIDELRSVGDMFLKIPAAYGDDAVPPYAAVAGPVGRPADYPTLFATARGAIQLATLRGAPAGTLILAELGLIGLLLQLPDVSVLSRYADEILAPLRTFDNAHQASLLPTLSALVHHDLSAGKAAASLHVRKSVVELNRRQIEDMLSVDLSHVPDLKRLSTAVDVYDVVEAQRRQIQDQSGAATQPAWSRTTAI